MKMNTNKQPTFIWGFMLENTYFTPFDEGNYQKIEDAYNQRKKKPASYFIKITDSHLAAEAKIYFGVAQVHLRMPGTRYYVKRKTVRQLPPSQPSIDVIPFNNFVYQSQCYGLNCWCLYMPGCCGLIQLPNNVGSNNIQNNYVQNTEMTSNTFAHFSEAKSTICDKNAVENCSPYKYATNNSTDRNFADGYSLAGDSTTSDSASIYTHSSSSVDSNSLIDINLFDNSLLGNSLDNNLPNNSLDSNLLGGNPLDVNFFNINYFDISSFAGNDFTGNSFTDPNFINHVLANNLATWNPVVPSQDFTNLGYQGFQTYQC